MKTVLIMVLIWSNGEVAWTEPEWFPNQRECLKQLGMYQMYKPFYLAKNQSELLRKLDYWDAQCVQQPNP